jgi:hypothetical protein
MIRPFGSMMARVKHKQDPQKKANWGKIKAANDTGKY